MSLKAFNLAAVALALSLVPAFAAADPVTLKFSFFTSRPLQHLSVPYQAIRRRRQRRRRGHCADQSLFQWHDQSGINRSAEAGSRWRRRLGLSSCRAIRRNVSLTLPSWNCLDFSATNARRACIFTRLVEAGALEGYQPFFVVGAFVTDGESIHSRKPIATIADLKGQKIRVNNEIEAKSLRKLGAIPVLLPLNQTMDALSQGKIDGVTVAPSHGVRIRLWPPHQPPLSASRLVARSVRFGDEPREAREPAETRARDHPEIQRRMVVRARVGVFRSEEPRIG